MLGNLRKLELYSKEPVSQWCKYPPWPKQQLFLELTEKEALFGGSAGGGKSSSLLLAALQYVHVPSYSALILRTDLQRLRLAGGLIPRSHEWLVGTGTDWNGNNFMWTFPSGATLQFGYLSTSFDKFRYGSSEYQYIAFDELTEFVEEDYLFLFSRLRKTVDINVPYRVRSATNPGGRGHDWVKNRFVTEEAIADLKNNTLKGKYVIDGRAFIPAKIRDNPAVNPAEYEANLMHLSPVERERLMNGDWTIMPTGLIKAKWLRYYTMRHRLVDLLVSRLDVEGNILHTNEVLYSYDEREEQVFITIDAAGGVEDIEKEYRGKPLSWTAIGVWGHKRFGNTRALRVRYIRRAKGLSYSDMKDLVKEVCYSFNKPKTYVENKAMGMALVSDLSKELPIEAISSGIQDKVARNAPFTNMMEQGQVYLPQYENSWKGPYESELLGWLGRKEETNDQIDISGYAAIICGGFQGGIIKSEIDPRQSAMDLVNSGKPMGQFTGGGFMNGWR